MLKIINDFNEIKLLLDSLNIQDKYSLLKNKKNYNNFKYSSILEVVNFLKNNNDRYMALHSVKDHRKYIKNFISSSKTYMYFSDKTDNLFNFSNYQFNNIIKYAQNKELLDLLNILFKHQEINKIQITLNVINDKEIILNDQYIDSLTHLFFTNKIEWLTGRLKFNEIHISNEETIFLQNILNMVSLSKVKEKLINYLNYPETKIIEQIAPSLHRRDMFIELDNKDSAHLQRMEYFKQYVTTLKSIVEAIELKEIISNQHEPKVLNKKRL